MEVQASCLEDIPNEDVEIPDGKKNRGRNRSSALASSEGLRERGVLASSEGLRERGVG